MALKKGQRNTKLSGVIEGVDPEVNVSKYDPIEYGRYIEKDNRINKEENIEVDHRDGGDIEPDKRHEGIEVQPSRSSLYHRPSIPVSALTALPSESHSDDSAETFWVILGFGAFLVVASLIGGLVGGLLQNRSSKTSAIDFTSSNLAAVNWTTGDNDSTHVVIAQAPDRSLVAYREQNNTWTEVNISQLFKDSGGLGAKANTPLAAVATSDLRNLTDTTGNQLSVFFLTEENSIVQIVSHDTTLIEWDWGTIGPHSDVALTASPGSQLAATWERCNNFTVCDNGRLSVVFEDAQQHFIVANSTYGWEPSVANKRLAQNSSLTLISMHYDGGDSDYTWGFFDTNGILGSSWEDYQKGTWWWTDSGRDILYDISPSTQQHFAAASFTGNRTHAFLAVLFPDGTVTGKHWDPILDNWHPEAKLRFADGTPETTRFSTVAMSADARFYGIAAYGGTIQEFRMDVDDAYTFHWLGNVS